MRDRENDLRYWRVGPLRARVRFSPLPARARAANPFTCDQWRRRPLNVASGLDLPPNVGSLRVDRRHAARATDGVARPKIMFPDAAVAPPSGKPPGTRRGAPMGSVTQAL